MIQLMATLVTTLVLLSSVIYGSHASSQEYLVSMRDGVLLHTIVDFPLWMDEPNAVATPAPSCYTVSPYGHTATELVAEVCLLWGAIGVRQDMRGTHKSGGKFTIWHSAANDSYDTMQWISQQPWSNGEIYGLGASADGLAAFAEAKLQPPWLKKQWAIFASSVGYPITMGNGMYHQALTEMWMKSTVPTQYQQCVDEIMANEYPGVWWDALNLTSEYWKVKWPARMWSGWYDIFLLGQLEAFNGYQKYSDPSVRGQTQIVIDPLGHCQGAAHFFPKNLIMGRVILPISQALEFLADKKPSQNTKAATFYVMSSADSTVGNYWTTLADWPEYNVTSYYFHADGTLSTKMYATSTNTSYIYDPKFPVKTIGGNNLAIACGPLDQQTIEQKYRSDVLTYTTPILSEPVVLTGPINAVLFVSSNCTDTDFTVKITDVYPNGESHLIQDGGIRMRWRYLDNGAVTPTPMTPGVIYRGVVSLWNTSYVFAQGHSIRVSISSSNAPRFSINPNNGAPLSKNGTLPMLIARNTIYQSSMYASRIELPIVKLSQLPPMHVTMPNVEELVGGDLMAAKYLNLLLEREANQFGMTLDELAALSSPTPSLPMPISMTQ